MERQISSEGKNLAGDFFRPALALCMELLGDPLATLVRVRERVPRLLVEVGVAPGGAGLGLVIDLTAVILVGEPLAQP